MTSPAPQATDHHASTASSIHDGLPASTVGTIDTGVERASLASRAVATVREARFDQRFMLVLLVLFAAKGVIFAFAFPAFSGHDEVAHYAYIKVLMEEGRAEPCQPARPIEQSWHRPA